jgi:hypothetical protein
VKPARRVTSGRTARGCRGAAASPEPDHDDGPSWLLAPPRWTIVVVREQEQGRTGVQDGAGGVRETAAGRHAPSFTELGPHFEALAAEWVARYAYDEKGLTVGAAGQSVVACRDHQAGHEVDVLALARGFRPRTPGAPIAFSAGLASPRTWPQKPGAAAAGSCSRDSIRSTACFHEVPPVMVTCRRPIVAA